MGRTFDLTPGIDAGANIGEMVRQALLVLALIIVAAKLGEELRGRLGQPPMLGGKPILSPTTFSALVLMVMLTTFITPPLLKLAFERRDASSV